jgi:hypothetical protein
MTHEIIKNNIEQLINDKNNSVIALSRKWGTGPPWATTPRTKADRLMASSYFFSEDN